MKKIHLNRAQNGQRKTLFFLAAKKKKLTILFALLCASMMSFELKAATEASCTIAETGYEYTFSNNVRGDVTLVVTLDAALPGASPAPNVYSASNAQTIGSTSDGKVFTFSLGQFSDGDILNYRTYFPYESGGLYQQSNLHYTVGTSCSGSEPTGMCGSNIFDSNIGGEDPYKIKLTSVKIDNVYYVRVESTKDGASIQRVFTDNIWCHTSYGNLQLGIAANHRVIDGKLYFIIPSTTVPYIYTGDGVYVHYTDGADRSYPSTHSVPLTECSDEIDYGVDVISPSITAASLVSKTSANAIIEITATDNVAVTACTVYDGTARLGDYAVVDGKITVTELMFNHAYTLTIKAKDAAGNMSANSADVAVTTDDNTEIIDHSPGENLGNMAVLAGTSATSTTGNAGAAIDDNTGSRWESASSDPQVWTLDLGQERVFNNIQVRWEGAYGKTFTLAISNDNINWTTVHYIKGQSLSEFPYEQSIDLPQLKARYIRFHGIERGTGYGYSFWEFRVFFAGEPPVLSTITASVDKRYCQVSTESANISLICKDQYNQDIDPGEVTYNVLPDASYGTVTAGVFTPLKPGLISITAQAGLVVSNTVQIWGTSSANLAYNHLHSASTGESVIDDRPASQAVDNNEGTEWQSHAGTADTDEGRTYDAWLIVDLGDKYDVELVAVKFEGASSQIYRIEFIDDLANEWKEGATYSGGAGINPHRDEHSSLSNNTGVRFVRLFSTKAATQYGMKVQELRVFGTVAASPTKSVSAAVNDPAMGTATVKQNDAVVTEVATGSTVTFSATPNDGYVFVNWSNGETRATFDAVVNSNMNLTANFRALGTIYCNTEMTASGHTIYVTLKKSGENEYKLIVNSTEELSNFGGTVMYKPNNTEVKNLRNQGVLSNSNHTLTGTMTSDRDIYFGTPLYVVFAGVGEITYSVDQGVANTPEFAVPCADAVTTGVALSQTSANLLLGSTLTLTPSFTPAYATDRALTWETSNPSIATVDGGVVMPVATGSVTITAKLTSNNSVYATCNVKVVDALTPATWYGYSTIQPQEGLTAYTYSITRGTNHKLTFKMTTDKNVVGYVSGIEGDVTGAFGGYDAENHTGTFTTAGTYTDGAVLHLRLTFASASYGATPLAISYRVGSSNDSLPQAVAVDEKKDNNAILTTYNGQTVIGVLGRSFTAGNLYTLVLPFDVDAAQTAEKLPGQLTKLNNSYLKENGDLRINFVDANAIEAGVPYLYQPSEDVTNPTFEGVTVRAARNPSEADPMAKYYGIYAPMNGDDLHALSDAYVLGPDQYLYAVSDLPANQTMKALRAYFVLNFPSAAPGAPKRLAKVVFNENETETTTDIENLQTDNTCIKVIVNGQLQIIRDGKTYNAFGQLVK